MSLFSEPERGMTEYDSIKRYVAANGGCITITEDDGDGGDPRTTMQWRICKDDGEVKCVTPDEYALPGSDVNAEELPLRPQLR